MPPVPVEHKDVVLAMLGASAALAGLILVFVGLVVGAYGGLAGDTPKSIRRRLQRTAGITVVPFGLGIACMVAASVWLLDQLGWLYVMTVVLFLGTLLALVGATFCALRELLWG